MASLHNRCSICLGILKGMHLELHQSSAESGKMTKESASVLQFFPINKHGNGAATVKHVIRQSINLIQRPHSKGNITVQFLSLLVKLI